MRKWDRQGTYNWETHEYEISEGDTPVYILAEDDDGGGWDWEITSIVARKIGNDWEYAVYEDGGCSCNSPYENNPSTLDLSWNIDSDAILKSAVRDMSVSDAMDFRTEFYQSLKELFNV